MARQRLVICLDGTWNNAQKRATRRDGTGVLKPTNVLKTARAVLPLDDQGTRQITLYYAGLGSMVEYQGAANRALAASDRLLGGATGAGFESSLEIPITFLANNYQPGDEVFIVGFSRGAAQARAMTHFLEWLGGLPRKNDAYFVPLFYRDYLMSKGQADPRDTKTERKGSRPGPLQPLRVKFLGVWDTVQAHGPAFLLHSLPAACVDHALHALAVDERRYAFRPQIWTGALAGQVLEQRWFAGVHSNVGGGYLLDGLANISLHWILGEAAKLGLATDPDFTRYYAPYPQAKLYKSMDWKFALMDLARLKRGVRPLVGYPSTANFSLDESVLARIRSDPKEGAGEGKPLHWQMEGELYRPRNVREYLKTEGRVSEIPSDW